MMPDAHIVATHVDRVASAPKHRTISVLVTCLLGSVGVVLFGIGLVEVWGGIWSAFGFAACVGVVAISGYDLAQNPAKR